MIVTDFAMISTAKNLLHEHIIILVHITILNSLVDKINLCLVLAIAPLVTKTPLLDAINQNMGLLLNHVLIVIEVNHTQIQKTTLRISTNPLLTLLNSPPQ